MSDKVREEFEAWVRREHPGANLSRCEGGEGYICSVGQYVEFRVQDTWVGWQASRAEMIIELPEPIEVERIGAGCTLHDEYYEIEEILEAIHAAGVKTK